MVRRAVVVAALGLAGCGGWPWRTQSYQPEPSRPVEDLRQTVLARVDDPAARQALLKKLTHVQQQYQRREKQRHELQEQVASLRRRLMHLEKFRVTKIELHPLTGLQDVDHDGRPDVLEVHVRTLDRQGDDVSKTDGVFDIRLRRETEHGAVARSAVLAKWRCKAGEEARDNPGRVFNHHVFRLALRNPIGPTKGLVVVASLHAEGEEPLEAKLPLGPASRSAP